MLAPIESLMLKHVDALRCKYMHVCAASPQKQQGPTAAAAASSAVPDLDSSAMDLTDYIKVHTVEKVFLYECHQPRVEGTLNISSYHLVFSQQQQPPSPPLLSLSNDGGLYSFERADSASDSTVVYPTSAARKSRSQILSPPKEICLLHRLIDVVERRGSGSTMLHIKCKDLRILRLDIPGVDKCSGVADSINVLKRLTSEDVKMCYPFFYRPIFRNQPRSPTREVVQLPSRGGWRFSEVNKDFTVCSTYPTRVVVPSDVTDDELRESALFREGGRFPVLAYSWPATGAVLMRSGQPLVGPNNRRCRSDENLLSRVISGRKKGFIMDLRTIRQTEAARIKGGGLEPENHYTLWQKINKPIELSVDSYSKFIDACNDETLSVDKWLSRVESSGWLSAVMDVMQNACLTAQFLHEDGVSVLIHGKSSMYTTLAVTSLTQIIIDPSLRTIKGFEELIDREWLSAGHPFQSCYETGPFSSKGREAYAPTFVLFLDCVYQLMYQFPCCFEFNQHFLLSLITHVYASSMGTFLGNSPRERARLRVSEETVSLWTALEQPEEQDQHVNPLYEQLDAVIWPSVAPQSIQLWKAFYLRKTYDSTQDRLAEKAIKAIVEEDREATRVAKELRETLERLQAIKSAKDMAI